ncbi:hypothetical protein HGI47_10205 [Novosphingobium sp. ERN07]|uniref:hypothetical protein n=1 Tax=Novosphingobium sp. ERN07 TaxID=2726187 RepID=UPI001456EC0A|nr:hypothetical protein [Novosphingobium sp. ERN07]NLR71246.1 hypothetical protein [Novosphingobium sp. ERN07]
MAFSQGCEISGILNLLDVAREALDRNGFALAAAHLDMATIAVVERGAADAGAEFRDMPVCQ